MSDCTICKNTKQLKISVTVGENVGGTMFDVPGVRYVACPECKMQELEEMYTQILDETITKYEAKFDELVKSVGGSSITSVFEVDSEMANIAKSNPHELLQRLLTKTIDDMKEEIFMSSVHKVGYDNKSHKYTIETKLNMVPHVSVSGDKSAWKNLDQFDDWLCKNLL